MVSLLCGKSILHYPRFSRVYLNSMAEDFSKSLVASGLNRFPRIQTFTYISGGVSSALDFWLTTPNVIVESVRVGGSTIAQHRPLSASFTVDLLEGKYLDHISLFDFFFSKYSAKVLLLFFHYFLRVYSI